MSEGKEARKYKELLKEEMSLLVQDFCNNLQSILKQKMKKIRMAITQCQAKEYGSKSIKYKSSKSENLKANTDSVVDWTPAEQKATMLDNVSTESTC